MPPETSDPTRPMFGLWHDYDSARNSEAIHAPTSGLWHNYGARYRKR
jgi:hypothetical protein